MADTCEFPKDLSIENLGLLKVKLVIEIGVNFKCKLF